jgi:exodeoxyribonuclease VII large subunit
MTSPQSILSISELNRFARQILEREFPLCWVSGEVSNLTRAASGHVYFSLKDQAAQVRCVMFRMRAQTIPWRLENGQHIEAQVLVSLYEPRGDFQLSVEAMRRAGIGRLFEEFTRLKEKLQHAGLFAEERKQALPRFPRRIGIVSSPQAAAMHDVLVALRRRAAHLPIILYPTPVQGEAAPGGIAAAISQAGQRDECDVLLLVRGGGSMEDLWAFNEETVARAIADSHLPIVSGIGHETDSTIADFVADVRAATPTAAAELATQGWFEMPETLAAHQGRLHAAMARIITQKQQHLDRCSLRLIDPISRVHQSRSRLDMLSARLHRYFVTHLHTRRMHINSLAIRLNRNVPKTDAYLGRLALLDQRLQTAMARRQQQRRHALDTLGTTLAHLNPRNIQARGFAIVRTENGKTVDSIQGLHPGAILAVEFHDGQATTRVLETKSSPPDKTGTAEDAC